MTDPNPTPPAVRIARFARSSEKWEATNGIPHLAWCANLGEWFSINHLDCLALAEQKVCAAGLGYELYECLLAVTGNTHGKHYLQTYAPAATRAAALIAVLQAHPELESAG